MAIITLVESICLGRSPSEARCQNGSELCAQVAGAIDCDRHRWDPSSRQPYDEHKHAGYHAGAES